MAPEIEFRMLLAALFVGFVFHRGYFHRKMAASEAETIEAPPENRLSRFANLLALPGLLGALLYVVNPAWIRWSALPLPDWIRWFGVGLAGAGFVLLQWSQQSLGASWSSSPRMLKSQRLIRSGPYRWIRHPIYSAFLLILGSPLLISANWFIGGIWITLVILDVSARIRSEESLLLEHFGDEYRAYMQTTGQLLPRF